MKQNKLVYSTFFVLMGMIVVKIIGFVREIVIANYFGLSTELDSYIVASTIPWMIFGTVSTAVISTTILTNNRFEERKAVNESLFLFLSVISFFITLILYLINPYLLKVLAPGFSDSNLQSAISMANIMLPMIIFLTYSGFITGILNFRQKFLLPSLIGLPYNIIIIVLIIMFSETLGIYALAIGTLLGTVLQVFFQLPGLRLLNLRKVFKIKIEKDVLVYFFVSISPIILGSLVTSINVIVDRILASNLNEGTMSALNFANRTSNLSVQLIAATLANVLLPSLGKLYKNDNKIQFYGLFNNSKYIMLFVLGPVIIIIFNYSKEIVELLFERGNFTKENTLVTSQALMYYSFSILGISLREIYNRVLFAMNLNRITLYIGIITVALNVILSSILLTFYEHIGIALGTSIANIVSCIILERVIRKRSSVKENNIEFLKISFAIVITLLLVNLASDFFKLFIENSLLNIIIGTLITLIIYLLLAYTLRITPLKDLMKLIAIRFFKKITK